MINQPNCISKLHILQSLKPDLKTAVSFEAHKRKRLWSHKIFKIHEKYLQGEITTNWL